MAVYSDYYTPQKLNEDIDAINDAIKNILNTDIGSLPGKPTFGSRLKYVLFEQMDDITEELARRVIVEAISRWEDRIIVTNVQFIKEQAYNRYIINVNYVLKSNQVGYRTQVSVDFA